MLCLPAYASTVWLCPSVKVEQEAAEARHKAEEAAASAKERGTVAFKAGNYAKAAESYYEACKHAPTCRTHFSNLALALLKLEQPSHAATAAKRSSSDTTFLFPAAFASPELYAFIQPFSH